MPNASASRFRFVAHALRGDGPFRPEVTAIGDGTDVQLSGDSALVRYPRESALKYARRNDVAFYASPLMRACARFVGYLGAKPPQRELPGDLYKPIADDVDGKGSAIDVFWSQFMVDAKARGTMLLQVDMPASPGENRAQQIAERRVPVWISIAPESVTDYKIGDDGKFDFVEYGGTFDKPDGSQVPCTWRFDREAWSAIDDKKNVLDQGVHPLKECPVLIFTEAGDFPSFGPFASIADIARRLFNAESELDEILRAQTFSLLTMQVPDAATDTEKLGAAKVVGETIGTANLMVHTGSTPAFIAPPDGPARVYLDRIKGLHQLIAEVGLDVGTVNERESGLAMRMRFAAINAELAGFAGRMEDLERRAWDLSRRWLSMQGAPAVQWTRDYNLADIEQELRILAEMQAAGMPAAVIAEQQRRIVAVQFGGLEQDRAAQINQAIDERESEPRPTTPQPVGP